MNVAKRFIRGEFIGRQAKVLECTDASLKGTEGTIVDESKNMLVIETDKKTKKIAKNISTFEIEGEIVNGKRIAYRPEDRIRKIK